MIAQAHIEAQKALMPWRVDHMIEQDLVISKALISLYTDPHIRNTLVFRGGTALNKLYLRPPARYSEDIDLVQLRSAPIGSTIQAIRNSLSWLGNCKTKIGRGGSKMFYTYENLNRGSTKLKIEINTLEHFHVVPLQHPTFSLGSDWFTGSASMVTYSLEELMATKLRALFQRRKGRDLFDIWYVLSQGMVAIPQVIQILHKYNQYNSVHFTSKMFTNNLLAKAYNTDFREDMRALLPVGIHWDFDLAFSYVLKNVIPLI